MFHYFCRARYDLDNLANGIFPCHKLQGVFTEVNECMYVVWNIKKANCFIFKCEWGWVCVCVYVCVCGVWWGGGCNDITESYGGDQVQLIIMNQNPPAPTPLPQVMNNDRPPFSYLFTCIFLLFYSIYLFIYSFILWLLFFSAKGEYQKELFYLTYQGSVPINLCLAFIWMRFGILLYREVRKKWFPSERRVSHLWGTRHTAVQHPACARGPILASRAPISALKDNIRNHHSLAKYAKENWNVPRYLKKETGYIMIMYIAELKRYRKTSLNGSILSRHCLNNSFYLSEPYDKSK